ncbi:hypothetical protein [Ancylobacter sp. FA202]|uniref:hypothetical protein n=1 Tax=Ancylobacter sp. FA202 TaxID=1111106 RepID=UPI00036D373C|nr:hypothetical protein [Ancylobacter sp. FA202]
MRVALAIVGIFVSATAVGADEIKKRFGTWEVSIDKDRFNGESKVIALSMQQGDAVAVRCFPPEVSVVVGELSLGAGRFEEGMEFDVRFRADEGEIIEATGVALSDKIIQVEESRPMAEAIKKAKEFAFRLSFRGVTFDKVFKTGKGGQALGEVFKACP